MKAYIIFFAISTLTCQSQPIDSINIKGALTILENYYPEDLHDIEFAIYNLRDKYLIIKKGSDSYEVDYVSTSKGIEKSEKFVLTHEIFNTLFEEFKNSKKAYIYSSDNYKDNCVESYIYFAIYNKDRKKQFEFNLPSILLCTDKKIEYPIKTETHSFLFQLLSNYWYNK